MNKEKKRPLGVEKECKKNIKPKPDVILNVKTCKFIAKDNKVHEVNDAEKVEEHNNKIKNLMHEDIKDEDLSKAITEGDKANYDIQEESKMQEVEDKKEEELSLKDSESIKMKENNNNSRKDSVKSNEHKETEQELIEDQYQKEYESEVQNDKSECMKALSDKIETKEEYKTDDIIHIQEDEVANNSKDHVQVRNGLGEDEIKESCTRIYGADLINNYSPREETINEHKQEINNETLTTLIEHIEEDSSKTKESTNPKEISEFNINQEIQPFNEFEAEYNFDEECYTPRFTDINSTQHEQRLIRDDTKIKEDKEQIILENLVTKLTNGILDNEREAFLFTLRNQKFLHENKSEQENSFESYDLDDPMRLRISEQAIKSMLMESLVSKNKEEKRHFIKSMNAVYCGNNSDKDMSNKTKPIDEDKANHNIKKFLKKIINTPTKRVYYSPGNPIY